LDELITLYIKKLRTYVHADKKKSHEEEQQGHNQLQERKKGKPANAGTPTAADKLGSTATADKNSKA
jgi:hypothetical protein